MTNNHFRTRVFDLASKHLFVPSEDGARANRLGRSTRVDPILPPLTPDDTALYPSASVNTYTAYISPWIDLCSTDPVIANISRQVLNLEVNYANFCGVKCIVIPGPSRDASKEGGNQGLAQYSRAVEEALTIGSRLSIIVHIPVYREPITDEISTLSSIAQTREPENPENDIDLYSAWDSWHHIRSICNYNTRLFVGML